MGAVDPSRTQRRCELIVFAVTAAISRTGILGTAWLMDDIERLGRGSDQRPLRSSGGQPPISNWEPAVAASARQY
jgi:hypothetical protein